MTVCVKNRSLAWLTGLATLIALIVPVMSAAPALAGARGSQSTSFESAAIVPPGTTLDCDDEDGLGDAETDDRSVNLSGESETYTCTVTDGVGDPVEGVLVDGEHRDANDPDNRGFGSASNLTADYDPACTTEADGTCSFELVQDDPQEFGIAVVCFWVDDDADDQYRRSGDVFDGGDCQNNEDTELEAENNDLTDKVSTTWVAGLDATPETDISPSGGHHTVRAFVTLANGAPDPSALVDFEIESPRNSAIGCDDAPTDAEGIAICLYNDQGSPSTGGEDIIRVSVDGDVDAVEAHDDDDADNTDVVTNTWVAAPRCSDGVDNDGDGRTDSGDPGCASPADNSETDSCDINGTPQADVLVGTGAGEIICGRGGGDRIAGNGGADTLIGGLGADTLNGGLGADTIIGGSGADRLRGGQGGDKLLGGLGNDRLKGGGGRDTLKGGGGSDFLDGGNARDRCRGGSGTNRRRRCE